jgi:hypothetical protein
MNARIGLASWCDLDLIVRTTIPMCTGGGIFLYTFDMVARAATSFSNSSLCRTRMDECLHASLSLVGRCRCLERAMHVGSPHPSQGALSNWLAAFEMHADEHCRRRMLTLRRRMFGTSCHLSDCLFSTRSVIC